jgi:hypothetical protein
VEHFQERSAEPQIPRLRGPLLEMFFERVSGTRPIEVKLAMLIRDTHL